MKIRFILFFLILYSSIFAQDIQWASKVMAVSSEDEDKSDSTFFKAKWVLGEPQDFSKTVLQSQMWKPKISVNKGEEWIKVGFEKPLIAKKVIIHKIVKDPVYIEIKLLDSVGKEVFLRRIYAVSEKQLVILSKENTSPIHTVLITILPENSGKTINIDAIGLSTEIYTYNPPFVSFDNSSIDKNFFKLAFAEGIPEKIELEKLNKNINSKIREVAPIISSDEKSIYFTREGHEDNLGKSKMQDIWFSEKNEKNEWNKAINIGKPLNNDSHNAATGLSFNRQKIFLVNEYNSDGTLKQGLSYSERNGDKWAFPKPIKINDYYNLSNYSEFSFSANEDVLIMAIAQRDSYFKKSLIFEEFIASKDLYVSFRIAENHYSTPKNIGSVLNTNEDESTPILAADSKTLYFSSKAHGEFRDSDIYMTKRLDDTWLNWSDPVNLGEGINTPKWDAYFSVTASGEYAYICQESKGTKEDIYRVKLYDSIKPEPISIIEGVVLDAETKTPIHTEIILKEINGKDKYSVFSKPETGKFTLVFPKNYQYKLIVESQGFTTFEQEIDNSKQENMFRMPLEILLKK